MKVGGNIGKLLAVIAFLVLGAVVYAHTNANDKKLMSVSDCVVAQAKAQGYTGNAYSAEAWNLFVGNCK